MLATTGCDDLEPLHFWPSCWRQYEDTGKSATAAAESAALGTSASGRRKGGTGREEISV